ncbi:MAG TPA: FG-GAP-like repeat-containing protein [Verrucomicrobiae bacterium]|nr:FG-GAP-like repeat-containing protein [Verrucomicrobiae bacterium]
MKPSRARRRALIVVATVLAAGVGVAVHAMGPAAADGASAPPAGGSNGPAEDPVAAKHIRAGADLAQQGRQPEAVAAFRRALAISPRNADAHFLLGRSLLEIAVREGRPFDEAAGEMKESLRLDPTRDYIRLQLAEIFGRRIPGAFDPDATIALYQGLIDRNPDRPDFRLKFVQWIFAAEVRMKKAGDPRRVYQDSGWAMDHARYQLEKVIDQVPRSSDGGIEARTLLAEVQYRSGEWEAARATLGDLISQLQVEHRPGVDLSSAWNTIGHTYFRQNDYRKAADTFRKACEIKPTLTYLYDLRMAWDAMGGYAADVPQNLRFPLRDELYDRAHPPDLRFTDIAPQLHLDKFAGAGPASWADYDMDGKTDVVVCGCDTYCTLYRAQGSVFADATIDAKLTRTEPGFGAVWADYDNDGDPDLYIARNGWNGPAPNSLLRNNGDGTFTDVAGAAGVADRGSSFNLAWFDYDRDGWLDLVVTNGVYIDGSTNQLYHNRRDGTFENVTAKAGVAEKPGFGTIGVAVGDYDDDGWPDIFYHGRMTQNRLYHNNHDGTFTEVAARAHVQGSGKENGYIAFFSDHDSDGDLDIWTGSLAPWEQVLAGYQPGYEPGPVDNIPRLYRNNGDGTFTDISIEAGFKYPLGIMAAGVADLDNDGYVDLYLGTGNPELRRVEPKKLYRNIEGKRFEDITRFSGTGNLGKGHGVTFSDWDADGDLDIYTELGGFFHGDWWHSAFYRNELGNRKHWLNVRLVQPDRNREAIGGRVTIHAGAIRQVQEATAGRGFGSESPPGLHFGLGSLTRVERIDIRWPDGQTQVLTDVAADRTLTVKRGEPVPQ